MYFYSMKSNAIPFISVIGLCLLFYNCQPNFVVSPKSTTQVSENGMRYYLPATSLEVELVVNKTNRIPGIFSAYAEQYLGYSGIQRAFTQFDIREAGIRPITTPDTENAFVIYTKSKNSPSFLLDEQGILIAINYLQGPESTNLSHERPHKKINESSTVKVSVPWLNLREKTDTVYKREVYDDSVVVERWQIEKILMQHTPEESAKEAARRISQLRKNRQDLVMLNEDVQYAAGTLEVMLKEASEQEAELFRLFLGYEESETFHYRFNLTPSQSRDSIFVLGWFSKNKGLSTEFMQGSESLSLKLIAIDEPQQSTQPSKAENGIYLRNPISVTSQLQLGNNKITEINAPIPQWGNIFFLPISNTAKIRIHPQSGQFLYWSTK
jgi:hypothetical protein